MNRLIDFILKRPKTVLCALGLITLLLIPGIFKLEFDNSLEVLMPKTDVEYLHYIQTNETYGDNGTFYMMSVSHRDLWTYEIFKRIDDLIVDIEEYKEYNEDIENLRLKKFNSIILKGNINYKNLISEYNDDPPFMRYLTRTIKKLYGNIEILSVSDLKKLKKKIEYSHNLKKNEIVERIMSPFTMKDIKGNNDTLTAYYIIERDENKKRILPKTDDEFTEFRKKLEKNPAFENNLYSRDPKTGSISDFGILTRFKNVKSLDPITREIWDIAHSYNDLNIISQGIPVIMMRYNDYMKRDITIFFPLVLLVLMVVLYFNFKSIRGIILPMLSLLMGTIWILGLMGHIGIKITLIGIILPTLMIAIGSSSTIHILNQYYIDFDLIKEKGKFEGLSHSMVHISTTVLLAALTTFASFLSLAMHDISAIREWAICSSIGVFFMLVISSLMLPASLMLLPLKMPKLFLKKDQVIKNTIVDRFIELIIKCVIVHNKKVIAIVIIILIISIIGIFQLRVETAVLKQISENDYIRKSSKIINQKYGGYFGINILIDSGEKNGVKDPEYLNTIEHIRKWLVSEENKNLYIGRTNAFSDFIKTMHMVVNNDDILYYKIPEKKTDIIDYLEILTGEDTNSDGRIDNFEPYVDVEFRTSNIIARLMSTVGDHIITSSDQKNIIDKISEYLNKNLPKKYSCSVTGYPLMIVKLQDYVVKGQEQSIIQSVFIVALIIILLFKNIKAGPIAMIDIGMSIIINFGIMGWFGIDLNVATSLIAAITIGIGVDDTIHLLNTFRYYRNKGESINEIITKSIRISGKAILYAALALIFGFSVLMMSSFIPLQLFGFLIALVMISTTIGTIIVIPSVIMITNVDLSESKSSSYIWKYLNISKLFGLDEVKNSE